MAILLVVPVPHRMIPGTTRMKSYFLTNFMKNQGERASNRDAGRLSLFPAGQGAVDRVVKRLRLVRLGQKGLGPFGMGTSHHAGFVVAAD